MIPELRTVGLSDKEARVYLALLEIGPGSVLEIAAKAAVNRLMRQERWDEAEELLDDVDFR